MKLDLKIPWNSEDEEIRRTTGAEFYGLRDVWNQHDSGVVYWNNMNAYNSVVNTQTVTSQTITNETITNATITTLTATNATIAGQVAPYLPLAGGTLTGNLIFNPTTKGILGTTTNDNVSAGDVGEWIASAVTAVNAATSTNYVDVTSISLTAGDWDVSVVFNLAANGATFTGVGTVFTGIVSGNNTTGLVLGDNAVNFLQPGAVASQTSGSIPAIRFSLASTTIVYLKAQATYTVATPLWFARISGRRVR